MTIGERIKSLRTEKGMTQTELAELLQTTKQNIFKYENGIVTNIPSDKIEKMAEIFGIEPATLMGWAESKISATAPPRTSEGSMFIENKDDYVERLVQVYKGGDILRRVLKAFLRLDAEEQKAVLKFVDNLSPEPEEKVLRIARNTDDRGPEIVTLTPEQKKRLDEAPDETQNPDNDI